MSIRFEKKNNELILVYHPERMDMDLTIQRLEKDELWPISRCFSVRKPYSRGYNSDEEELYFCIGKVHEHYTEIDADILDTEHTFYFANDSKTH